MTDIERKRRSGRPRLPEGEKAQSIHIKVPPALLEAIKERSIHEGLNQTQLMLKAVRLYLGNDESGEPSPSLGD